MIVRNDDSHYNGDSNCNNNYYNDHKSNNEGVLYVLIREFGMDALYWGRAFGSGRNRLMKL